MKRLLLILSAAILAFACSQNKPKVTLLSGQIENAPDTIVRIMSKGLTDTVFVDKNGHFSYKFELARPTYLTIRIGRPTLTVFIAPGNELTIIHNFYNGIENVEYKGDLAPQNQYLAKTSKFLRSALGDLRTLYSLPLKIFDAKLDSVKAQVKLSLSEVAPANKAFSGMEEKRIDFHFLGLKLDYPLYNSSLTGIKVSPDSVDYSFMKPIDLNDASLMSIPEYGSMLNKYLNNVFALQLQKTNANTKSNFEKRVLFFDLVDSLVANPSIRDFVKHTSILEIIQFESLGDAKNAAELFLKHAQEPAYSKLVQSAIDRRMLMAPGRPSPEFLLTGIDGATYKLSDFRGNLVYIDFWATWCRPCREQIPYFAKLKETYAGKPIKFVAISVDDDKEAWVKMVNEQGLKGIQLHAERAWSSDVVKQYQVRGIPTFVLVDGEGAIIEYNAPRPSDPDITFLIDKHLKSL